MSRDMAPVGDVYSYVPGYIQEPETDRVLQELISAVSTEWHLDCRRDFTPAETNPYAKTFDLTGWDAAVRKIWVGDLADTTGLEVEITRLDGTAVASLTMSDSAIIALPRNPADSQPYNELWFPAELADAPTLCAGDVVEVTGNWGFPAIPADVRAAVIKLVIYRYLSDVALAGTSFADAIRSGDVDVGGMFASAMATKRRYTMATVAAAAGVGWRT